MTTIEGAGTTLSPFIVKDLGIITAKLADNAVTTIKIADANVTNTKLATDAVETLKIKDLNVTTGKLADNAVTPAKLATDAVETLKIKDLNVTTGKLADNAVTSTKIQDGTITNADISNTAAIQTTKIKGFYTGNIGSFPVTNSASITISISDLSIPNGGLGLSSTIIFQSNTSGVIVTNSIPETNLSGEYDKIRVNFVNSYTGNIYLSYIIILNN
jgi:hypothetical protein